MGRSSAGRRLRRDLAVVRSNAGFLAAAIRLLGRTTLWLLAVAMVCGCAATREGTSYTSLSQKIGPPKAGTARVFVLRPKGPAELVDSNWVVQVDGNPMTGLKTGTFAYRDLPPGHHQLSFVWSDFPRPSRLDMDAVAGRTYFYRLELNGKGRMLAGGASAGVIGMLATGALAAAADDRGAYDFVPLDEAAARQALAELVLGE
jgi:Protein of unknown function (DUF2846)